MRVRICVRNPGAHLAAEDDTREGSSSAGLAEIREALALFWGLRQVGAEIRLHRAVLYNSIYRADNQLLVTQHVYSIPSERQPVLYLRSGAPGDMATTYIDAFERIWEQAHHLE